MMKNPSPSREKKTNSFSEVYLLFTLFEDGKL